MRPADRRVPVAGILLGAGGQALRSRGLCSAARRGLHHRSTPPPDRRSRSGVAGGAVGAGWGLDGRDCCSLVCSRFGSPVSGVARVVRWRAPKLGIVFLAKPGELEDVQPEDDCLLFVSERRLGFGTHGPPILPRESEALLWMWPPAVRAARQAGRRQLVERRLVRRRRPSIPDRSPPRTPRGGRSSSQALSGRSTHAKSSAGPAGRRPCCGAPSTPQSSDSRLPRRAMADRTRMSASRSIDCGRCRRDNRRIRRAPEGGTHHNHHTGWNPS